MLFTGECIVALATQLLLRGPHGTRPSGARPSDGWRCPPVILFS
jgi:hypothetical protein